MRAIWKGAVAFGLVNVPVRLYSATGEHEVTMHQVHREDGGRIRYRKTCSVCGETVQMNEIAKGYETEDGELVVLTDEDLDQLPLATGREIEVLEFVPAEQVDPILLGRTYYLEPDKTAVKPYALLRGAIEQAERMAVVKVALRQRESMAVLRVRGKVICLQTLLWPDEIREADFPVLDTDVTVRPQELTMASSLVDSLAGDFDPSQFSDGYAAALTELIEAKIASGSTQSLPQPAEAAPAAAEGGGDVVDLLAALQRSVEKARQQHDGGGGGDAGTASSDGPAAKGAATRAKGAAAKGSTAEGSTAKGASAKRAAAKDADAAEPATAKAAAKKPRKSA